MILLIKRTFEKLGVTSSLLGFGCMRFPTLPNGKIDEATGEKMLDYAMAHGVTYYDTAFPYHDGDSEPFVGRVLDKYDRSSYTLATKMSMWKIKTHEDAVNMFENQLKRLNKTYVDFYLLHALDKEIWPRIKELKIIELVEQLKAEGKIKYIGFSFHDDVDLFKEIIDYRDWDFCQIQYNYVDTDIQAGDEGYEYCKSKGIPMVIMEPVKGGKLANIPNDVYSVMDNVTPGHSAASWALRWVGTHDNVKVILSGMSS